MESSPTPVPINYPASGRLFFVFNFFELSVDNVVVFRVVRGSVSARLLLRVLLLSNFHQLLGSLCQLLHLRFDIRFVFAFQRRFQRGQCSFDSRFIFRWQFVARFFNLLTGAVQQMVTPGYGSEPALRTYGQIPRSLLLHEPFSGSLLRSDRKKP